MRAPVRFAVAPLILALSGGSLWAQHAISVPMEVEYNSNPTLTPDGESVTRYRVSPQYTLTRESGSTRSVFTFGGVVERSSNTQISDHRADPNIGYELEITAPTSVLTLNATLDEASSRTTEFEETGLVTEDSTVRTGLAGARWVKQLTDQTFLELAGAYARVRYETPLLTGYEQASAESSLGWQPAEGDRYTVMLSTARLNPDTGARHSSRQGLMLGHERRLSPSFRAEVGVGTVKTSGTRVGSDTVGMLLLAYEGERLTSDIEWVREISPSGSLGGYTLSQGLRWGLSYPLSEATTLTSSISRARSLELDGGDGQIFALGMRTELSPFWSMTFRVERARASFASGVTARGNAVGIGLVYAHPNF